MTLEELRLRVMAAFPDAPITQTAEPDNPVLIEVGDPYFLYAQWCPCCGDWIAHDRRNQDWGDAIRNVTAQEIIAARRRLQGTEPCSPPTT